MGKRFTGLRTGMSWVLSAFELNKITSLVYLILIFKTQLYVWREARIALNQIKFQLTNIENKLSVIIIVISSFLSCLLVA